MLIPFSSISGYFYLCYRIHIISIPMELLKESDSIDQKKCLFAVDRNTSEANFAVKPLKI